MDAKKHILILGGDGYLGWTAAMHFSALGYDVTAADNYFRRQVCQAEGIDFLWPVPRLPERSAAWHRQCGGRIRVAEADLAVAADMRALFDPEGYEKLTGAPWPGRPLAVLHLAEQPSAPYSLLRHESTAFTVVNNLGVTTNLLCAVRDLSPDSQIVHIGTMGEYGTPNIDIEEGWLEIEHKGRRDTFLYPRQASSVYHTTKIMDTDLMWYFVRAFNLAITDLMQGPVYGMETDESALDPALMPFFNYDDLFGTVLNRFIVQAVAGRPLTVYGRGGQTRGYINIRDTMQCLRVAVEKPAGQGELRILNQITETFSVMELAELVRRSGARQGLSVSVEHVPNPRTELEEHYYHPVYTGLRELGVRPHTLTDEVLDGMIRHVMAYRSAIRPEIIFPDRSGGNSGGKRPCL